MNPDFEDTLGAFKTPNPKSNRLQRRFIHLSSEKSRFRKTVETVLVVHGWETEAKKQPMSLIVLSVRLNCHAANFRIQSARMWFAFYEDDKASPPNTEEAAPEVVTFAPFVEQKITNVTPEVREVTNAFGGKLGPPETFMSGGVEASRAVKSGYTRQHFDRGTADCLVRDDRVYGVNWFCEQNKLTKYGVNPHFHVAVLLKREHTKADNKAISFSGVFDMRIEAGLIHDFNNGIRRAFRLGKPEDEAIYYDPNQSAQTGGFEGVGQELKANVEENNLGKLAGKGGLSRLLDPKQILSGLEPMAPSGADAAQVACK
ncbi:hypothetical protein N658DRAFT_517658 [Parathielavia hyrcaniae]|uniref:Uncharacterized protein n=1 Tax=Parathielavia hyrcaniae TaxID=113614 RepID=A0AAN6SZT4_9PEZI|nr:hypothetical protein N658DRAFT_517658 [Parathielavia hyrcaniae]